MWMLDTNICSYVLRKHPASVLERFYAARLEDLSISAIVAAELRYGASRLGSEKFAALLEQWLDLLSIEPWPEDASKVYARIRHDLERQGTPIGILPGTPDRWLWTIMALDGYDSTSHLEIHGVRNRLKTHRYRHARSHNFTYGYLDHAGHSTGRPESQDLGIERENTASRFRKTLIIILRDDTFFKMGWR